jgi:phosphoglycolate phosphatase
MRYPETLPTQSIETKAMTIHQQDCDGLIFDLDGTLIDSAPDIAAGINDYFAQQNWPRVRAEFVAGFTGNGPKSLLHDMLVELGLPSDDGTVDRAVEGYLVAYNRAPSRHTRFYDHVKNDLYALHARGFQLGICTNKPHELTLRILDILGIGHLFSAVAGADNVPACKPDPIHLLSVAERMGLEAGSWVYVGDTQVDQLTAARADVPFYAVPWGTGHKLDVSPEYRLTRLSDLTALQQAAFKKEKK